MFWLDHATCRPMYIGSKEEEHLELAEDLQEHLEGLLYVSLTAQPLYIACGESLKFIHYKLQGACDLHLTNSYRHTMSTLPCGLTCTATSGHVPCTKGSVSVVPLSMWWLAWEAENWQKEPCREQNKSHLDIQNFCHNHSVYRDEYDDWMVVSDFYVSGV